MNQKFLDELLVLVYIYIRSNTGICSIGASVMFTHFPAGRYTSRLFISAERTGATMLMCGKVTHRARQTAAPYSECQIQLFLITVSGNFILRVDYEFIDAIM